jgi:hypothetical protein
MTENSVLVGRFYKKKNQKKVIFFILKVTEEGVGSGSESISQGIRIRTKMSRIPNTG